MTQEIYNALEAGKARLFAEFKENYTYVQVDDDSSNELHFTFGFYKSKLAIGTGTGVYDHLFIDNKDENARLVTCAFDKFIADCHEHFAQGCDKRREQLRKEILIRQQELEILA